MIDMRKANLLEPLMRLPHRFVMPDTLFEDEWLCLDPNQKSMLIDLGLEVRSLSGDLVTRASIYFNRHARLKINDCFALALAEDIKAGILLTGDSVLRNIAEKRGIEVHGVLWAIDEMESHEVAPPQILFDALRLFHDDDSVFLPDKEVRKRLRRLESRLGVA